MLDVVAATSTIGARRVIVLAALAAFCGCSEAHTVDRDACPSGGCVPPIPTDVGPPPPAIDVGRPVDVGQRVDDACAPTGCAPLIDTGPPIDGSCGPLRDSGPPIAVNPDLMCTGSGRAGTHCRAGTMCISGATCIDPAAFTRTTVQGLFAIQQANPDDPTHPGYAQIQMPQRTCDSTPFNGFAGTFCAQQCDTSPTAASSCGACRSCSNLVTQVPIIAPYGAAAFFPRAMMLFPGHTGVCRVACTWSPTTRGDECPDASFTCDAFGSVCIEACTSDNECNTTSGTTYQGETVTVLNADHPAFCNGATGRCEVNGTPGATVGAHCMHNDECAPGTGVCLPGGRCAEFGCPRAGSTCGPSGSGVCLAVNNAPHPNTLCLSGCNIATDCGPGNSCQFLGSGRTIGTFGGYCFGMCRTDDQCIATETCTDTITMDATGATVSNRGRCVPRCAHVGIAGTGATGDCATTEWCTPDHAGATYGWCLPLGGFCGPANTFALTPAMATDCATSQRCDETRATPHGPPTPMNPAGPLVREFVGDGHCVPPCATTTDCARYPAGSVCVTTGALAGLCRVRCSGATDVCPADQVCDIALAHCVEVPPPM